VSRIFHSLFGVLLLAAATLSQAETIPATITAKLCPAQQANKIVADGQEVCNSAAFCTALGVGVWSGGAGFVVCNTSPTRTTVYYTVVPDVAGYTCPTGQNWTLTGSTCVRPDCAPDQTRDEYGQCQCPAGKELVEGSCKTTCPAGFHRNNPDNGQCEKDCIGDQTQESSGKCVCSIGSGKEWVKFSGSYSSNTGCANGCQYNMGGLAIGVSGGSHYTRGQRNGSICGDNTTITPAPKLVEKAPLPPADTSGKGADGQTPDPKNTPDNAKDPESCYGAGGSYGTFNGVGKCLTPSDENVIKSTKPSTSTTNNSDGSSTSTRTEETTTCNGKSCTSSSSSTTTTTGPGGSGGGSSTTTTTGAGSDDGSGQGQDKGDCTLEPDAPYCKTGTPKEKGHFGNGQDAKLEAAKAAVKAKLSQIKTDLSAKFSANASGGAGSLPCPPPVTILGRAISVCVADYGDQLSVIGAIIVFAASIIAVLLVVSA